MTHTTDSIFLQHIPCPECGSKDNRGVFTDGHEYCFGCGSYQAGGDVESRVTTTKRKAVAGLLTGEAKGLRTRKITDETALKFGYLTGTDEHERTVQIAPYYNADGQLVAQKVRAKGKDFRWIGEQGEALPFGAHVWPKTGRMIVVTEGEIDALSMSQVQGNKYPVVSIGCGAGKQISKYIARNREYFLGFEKVVLMFDNDEPGREAAKAAAAVLGSRAHIAELPLKDANEMLQAGKTEELIRAMWGAKQYRPEGIVDLASLTQAVKEKPRAGLSWCFPTLTSLTYGKRRGEIATVGAGTGTGKTDFLTQDMDHMVSVHGEKIGVFSLEQEVRETAIRINAKHGKKPFHIPDAGWTEAEFDASWASLTSKGKVFLYDSFGVNEWEAVRDKIEYLHHAEGICYFYVDHLTAFAAMAEDERKALEGIMADMGGLVKKLQIHITLVSHLATPEGKPHEEGGRVTVRHFKGSRSIGFWSHFMFGMERDQQAEDETTRTTTTFRVLKDRYTGRATGEVFYLGYDRDTAMLYETAAPEAGKNHGFKDESDTPEGDF